MGVNAFSKVKNVPYGADQCQWLAQSMGYAPPYRNNNVTSGSCDNNRSPCMILLSDPRGLGRDTE